jgi:hypothetical protein
MDGLDGCGKSCLHWDSIPGLSSPRRVAILTELPRPAAVRVDRCTKETTNQGTTHREKKDKQKRMDLLINELTVRFYYKMCCAEQQMRLGVRFLNTLWVFVCVYVTSFHSTVPYIKPAAQTLHYLYTFPFCFST